MWSIISSQDNLSTNGKLYTLLDFDFFNVNSAKYFSIKFDQQYHHKGGSTGRVPPPPPPQKKIISNSSTIFFITML